MQDIGILHPNLLIQIFIFGMTHNSHLPLSWLKNGLGVDEVMVLKSTAWLIPVLAGYLFYFISGYQDFIKTILHHTWYNAKNK